MILDSSFVVALLFEEPTAPACAKAWRELQESGEPVVMSTVNLTECLILFGSRRPSDAAELERSLMAMNVGFVPPDVTQARVAAEARLRYARLNFGDSFAYPLAKGRGEGVLTLDADFVGLDVGAVVPVA